MTKKEWVIGILAAVFFGFYSFKAIKDNSVADLLVIVWVIELYNLYMSNLVSGFMEYQDKLNYHLYDLWKYHDYLFRLLRREEDTEK